MERISPRAHHKREYTWWPKYNHGHTGKLFISHHFIRGMLTIMELRQTIQKYRPPSESSLLHLEQLASHSHFFLSVQSWSELSRKSLQSYLSRRERMDLDLNAQKASYRNTSTKPLGGASDMQPKLHRKYQQTMKKFLWKPSFERHA